MVEVVDVHCARLSEQVEFADLSSIYSDMNFKALKLIVDQWEGNHLTLICIGLCGLHTVQRSLPNEVVSWDGKIEFILKLMWNWLKDGSTRKEVYEKFTKSYIYPLLYSKTRWCGNEVS